jgi:hypothetical protein
MHNFYFYFFYCFLFLYFFEAGCSSAHVGWMTQPARPLAQASGPGWAKHA